MQDYQTSQPFDMQKISENEYLRGHPFEVLVGQLAALIPRLGRIPSTNGPMDRPFIWLAETIEVCLLTDYEPFSRGNKSVLQSKPRRRKQRSETGLGFRAARRGLCSCVGVFLRFGEQGPKLEHRLALRVVEDPPRTTGRRQASECPTPRKSGTGLLHESTPPFAKQLKKKAQSEAFLLNNWKNDKNIMLPHSHCSCLVGRSRTLHETGSPGRHVAQLGCCGSSGSKVCDARRGAAPARASQRTTTNTRRWGGEQLRSTIQRDPMARPNTLQIGVCGRPPLPPGNTLQRDAMSVRWGRPRLSVPHDLSPTKNLAKI